MATITEARELQGIKVLDRNDDKIGVVEEVFTDEVTGEPRFLGIGTGFLRMQKALVPIEGVQLRDDAAHVPYDKVMVKDSPQVSGDDLIDEAEALQLYEYYDLDSAPGHVEVGDDEAAVTRHEEEVRVGKRDVDAGRVRLRKWVETEPVTTDVDLEHEEARVEREPINRPAPGAQLGEKEVEVPLHEEEAVVEKDVVAKERVAVDKEVEHERRPVTETVSKEHVEADEDRR